LDVTVNYELRDEKSNLKSDGEAKAMLDEEYLTLQVAFGEPILLSYADIVGITEGDYKIDLFLTSKEKLNLSGLGYQYEDFLFQLFKLRNELLLKYLLMEEALLEAGFEAYFTWLDSNANINQTENCEIRLYETALVVLPQKGEPIRIPYCYISQVSKADYKLTVANEFGEKFEFSRLGEKFDPFSKALSDALNRMMLRTQESIRELLPEAGSLTVRKLAAVMKDGRAAKRKDIESLFADFWRPLTQRIKESGIDAEYEFLISVAEKAKVCVGAKRGLMGNLTGSYTWLLFPLRTPESNRLSNAVALEALTTQIDKQENEPHTKTEHFEAEEKTEQTIDGDQTPATKGATYFFRIMDRKEYSQAKDEDLERELDRFTKNIERAMIDVNFRREPIFLSENQLASPKYVQYQFAIAKMPSLKILRSLFIGRVIHLSTEQWKTDVTSLLAFNTKSLDSTEKWNKGDT